MGINEIRKGEKNWMLEILSFIQKIQRKEKRKKKNQDEEKQEKIKMDYSRSIVINQNKNAKRLEQTWE